MAVDLLIVGAAAAGGLQAGLVIDDWTETVPADQETTGVAFNFNRPNAVAPQALLVAVAPVLRGHWTWDDLVGSVHEALDLAKLRAVEPDRLFGRALTGPATDGAYFQALPAILIGVHARPPGCHRLRGAGGRRANKDVIHARRRSCRRGLQFHAHAT